MDLKLGEKLMNGHTDDHGDEEPVSPMAQNFSTSFLSLCVQGVFELEQPMEVCSSKKAIQDILLPRSPRFSCIMIEDDAGVLRWKKTVVNVDDHVVVPEFPPGQTEYDDCVNDYICNLHLTPLPRSRPLWEFHFLNYNTTKAKATLIINMHHSLGDGTSLMSMALSCVTRADNPNLPLTFPTCKSMATKLKSPSNLWSSFSFLYAIWYRMFRLVLVMWCTFWDSMGSVLRMGWIEDSKLPIRGTAGVVELLPKVMSSVTFDMDDIRIIKKSVGGTVNDVVMGVIFHGLQRYLRSILSEGKDVSEIDKEMSRLSVTALAPINIRAISGMKNVEEMLKPQSRIPWGNRFGLLHISVPLSNVTKCLDYVRKAKQIIDRKKISLGVFVSNGLLGFLSKFKGRQLPAKCLYNTLANTTVVISNMVGPMERIAMNKVPVKSFYFSISGLPQTLVIAVVSYKGSLRLQVIGTKGYVDAEALSECLNKSFEDIKEAAANSPNLK